MIQIIQEIGTPASYIFSKSVINTRTKKSSETDGSEDFSLLFATFSLGRRIGTMFCALASFHKNLYPLLCFLTLARLCVCQRISRHRECLIGQLPVFIVNVQMASERGFEVEVDG